MSPKMTGRFARLRVKRLAKVFFYLAISKVRIVKLLALLLLYLSVTGCVSTRVEASPYQDTIENLECREVSSWSYFWGLNQKRVDTSPDCPNCECPCREGSMNWVVVKTSLTDHLLSVVTLGTVNHRTVLFGCTRPRDGDGGLDD
ncbi:hypothetical protein [Croceiramulus getboli]|nr:hypothetical protein P8624_11245 [Flavobacteriaceae bacterium YJPT1-3]